MRGEEPAQQRFDAARVAAQVLGDDHEVLVQELEHRRHGLIKEGLHPQLQRLNDDVRDFGFLEVLVQQNQVELFADMLGIDWMV